MIVLCRDVTKQTMGIISEMKTSVNVESVIMLSDVSFLPDGIDSVYDYYLGYVGKEIKNVYYAFINTPKYWETERYYPDGLVKDGKTDKGEVFVRKPYDDGFAERVEWYSDNRKVYRTDYFNKYGNVYKKLMTMATGEELLGYYGPKGEEKIVINKSNGTVSVFEKGKLRRIFDSETAFIEFVISDIRKQSEVSEV